MDLFFLILFWVYIFRVEIFSVTFYQTVCRHGFLNIDCFCLCQRFCHVLVEEGKVRPQVHPKMSSLFGARKGNTYI